MGNIAVGDVLALGKQANMTSRRILDILRMHLPEIEKQTVKSIPKAYPPATPDEQGYFGPGGSSGTARGPSQSDDVESEV